MVFESLAKSTISTFLKKKEAIKAAVVAKGVTIVQSKLEPHIMDEVEKLLLIGIKEKELDGDSISKYVLRIYADLLRETPGTSAEGESGLTFNASRGWVEKFRHRSGIHGVGMERRPVQTRKQP